MLADLAGLLQYIDVFFAKLRIRVFRIVRVDELGEAQGASHAGRTSADNDNVSGHLWAINAGERFAENQHS
jgi:hypothetical protein